MRILIAEDETELAMGLRYLLEKNKFSVDVAHDGEEALDYIGAATYDAVVLDIMMPKKSGLEVLAEIRRRKSAVPVMMLTAKSDIGDRVAGLDAGADDYLPKPFSTKEFVARVRALTRRSSAVYHDSVLTFCSVELDRSCYTLSCGGRTVRLNNKEFQLLELFMQHPKMVFSTERLMETVWGLDSDADLDVVWTYIGYVRRKLRSISADAEIRTARGAGYSLEKLSC